MINKIKALLAEYKKALPENWKNEKYKWEAVKHFQDNWDINASDFGEMFKTATDKTNNLLGSSHSYPRGMMLEFIASDSEAVRQMFAALYDEQRPLDERIRQFQDSCDSLKDKYNNGTWKNHYQSTNSISVYLWLKYPDKYYIYKYGVIKDVSEALEADYKPIANGSVETMMEAIKFYDKICDVIQKDDELRSLFTSLVDESCYNDPMLKTLTMDFGYYISKYRDNDSISEQNVTYLSEIIAALEELGGSASQNDICRKIEERGNIPNIKTNPNWKGVVSNAITTHSRDSKAYVEGNEHLFYSVDGLGKGVWGLVDMKSDEIIDIDEDFDIYEFFNVGNTWLLAWNPKKSSWDSFNDEMYATRNGKGTYGRWSCANTNVELGDRIFVIKLGEKPKGIFATGYAVSKSYEAAHYDESKNTKINYIDVLLTEIEDYQDGDIILQDFLNEEFPEQNWSPQNSGIMIKPRVASELIDLWNNRKAEKDDVEEIDSKPRIWKISEGKDSTGLSKAVKSVLESRNSVSVNQYTYPVANQNISQGQLFMKHIKIGDYFYLCYASEIVLLGQEPFLADEPLDMPGYDDDCWYERSYRIIKKFDSPIKYSEKKKIWTPNFNSTCVPVKEDEEKLFEELILKPYFDMTLEELFSFSADKYTKEDFLKDVYLSKQDYTTLTSLMEHKKNVILQGAPGVGKIFAAKRLAYAMMGEMDESRIEFIQFHQNYSYEDFIMGYRPKDDTFELTEGVFYRFCERARNDSGRKYFFIIDEINRGNLSKIFGELLMLIEADKRDKYSVTLAYRDEKFSVPDNLYIIGTMNTADRSLAMIDYALRRRFSFFDMKPGFDTEGFKNYADGLQNDTFDSLITQIKLLNADIAKDLGKGFCIGHSYFCNLSAETCTDERIRQIVDYDILPMLYEYWFDSENKADNWKKKLYQAIGADYDE